MRVFTYVEMAESRWDGRRPLRIFVGEGHKQRAEWQHQTHFEGLSTEEFQPGLLLRHPQRDVGDGVNNHHPHHQQDVLEADSEQHRLVGHCNTTTGYTCSDTYIKPIIRCLHTGCCCSPPCSLLWESGTLSPNCSLYLFLSAELLSVVVPLQLRPFLFPSLALYSVPTSVLIHWPVHLIWLLGKPPVTLHCIPMSFLWSLANWQVLFFFFCQCRRLRTKHVYRWNSLSDRGFYPPWAPLPFRRHSLLFVFDVTLLHRNAQNNIIFLSRYTKPSSCIISFSSKLISNSSLWCSTYVVSVFS